LVLQNVLAGAAAAPGHICAYGTDKHALIWGAGGSLLASGAASAVAQLTALVCPASVTARFFL